MHVAQRVTRAGWGGADAEGAGDEGSRGAAAAGPRRREASHGEHHPRPRAAPRSQGAVGASCTFDKRVAAVLFMPVKEMDGDTEEGVSVLNDNAEYNIDTSNEAEKDSLFAARMNRLKEEVGMETNRCQLWKFMSTCDCFATCWLSWPEPRGARAAACRLADERKSHYEEVQGLNKARQSLEEVEACS
eukprot:2195438-Rhodomonas_salina.3